MGVVRRQLPPVGQVDCDRISEYHEDLLGRALVEPPFDTMHASSLKSLAQHPHHRDSSRATSGSEANMTETTLRYPSSDGIILCGIYCQAHADQSVAGSVLLAHGISVDKDEEGFFTQLAHELACAGYSSLRFDFRGHGESTGKQEEMTVGGEYQDLAASVRHLRSLSHAPLSIIAASFGAASACRLLAERSDIRSAVLLNPVLDLRATFLRPTLPWAKQSFHEAGFEHASQHGYLLLDGHFRIGTALIDEMANVFPYRDLQRTAIPVLTIHGDADTYVPYEIAKQYGVPNQASRFVPVPDAEHGFGRPHERDFVIRHSLSWIQDHNHGPA